MCEIYLRSRNTMHFRKDDYSTRLEEYSRMRAPFSCVEAGFVFQYVGDSPRAMNAARFLRPWARAKTQPTPTKAHVRMPSLPFELPRLLHGATVRQFPCQLVCPRASRLADVSSHSAYGCRAHAGAGSPVSRNTSAEIQKAGPIGVFTAVLDDARSAVRCFSRARQGNDLLPGDRLSREARVRDRNPS